MGGASGLSVMISGIDSRNTLLSKQIDDLTSRLNRQEEVLKAQFAKLETLVGQMQSSAQGLGALG
jgi:flagellar capping protein FliD